MKHLTSTVIFSNFFITIAIALLKVTLGQTLSISKINRLSHNDNFVAVFSSKTFSWIPNNTTIVTITSKHVTISSPTIVIDGRRSISAYFQFAKVGNITKNRAQHVGDTGSISVIRTRLSFVQINEHNVMRIATICTNINPVMTKTQQENQQTKFNAHRRQGVRIINCSELIDERIWTRLD